MRIASAKPGFEDLFNLLTTQSHLIHCLPATYYLRSGLCILN